MAKTTKQVEAAKTEEVAVVSKAAKAQAIYAEEAAKGEDKLRARVIKRFKDELGMGDAGASTYYQNCKKIAAGGKVKHYYKPQSKATAQEEGAETFGVQLKDGSLKVCSSQQELDDWKKDNADLIAEEQETDGSIAA